MKKFVYLFFVVCQLNLFAQDCELPAPYTNGSTGDNMTMMLTSVFINSFKDLYTSDNPYIVALSSEDVVVGSCSVKLDDLMNGMQSIAVWGDDVYTPEVDGALGDETITLKLVDGTFVFDLITAPITYMSNDLVKIESSIILNFDCEGAIKGCSNPTACNFDSSVTEDDGSCAYPQQYYDCSDQCLSDTDGDGICDELEIVGCTEPMACNYEPTATDEGICEYFGIDSCNVSLMEINRPDFMLYPNPGTDRINIQSANKQERLEISMTSILGAKLFHRSLKDIQPTDLIEINLPSLPSGIYMVTLSSTSEVRSIQWVKK